MLAHEIEALLGVGTAVETGAPGTVEGRVFPEEEALVARAVAKRRDELRAGRVLARRALARLGLPEVAIPAAPSRAPVWPEGATGSITHTRAFCAVVVGRTAEDGLASLGIDAEPAVALKPELVPRICTARERAWLDERPPGARGLLAKLVFSAKEAFYKAQSPLTGRFLEFEDVELAVDLERGTYAVSLVRDVGSALDGLALDGRFRLGEDLVLATARFDAARRSDP